MYQVPRDSEDSDMSRMQDLPLKISHFAQETNKNINGYVWIAHSMMGVLTECLGNVRHDGGTDRVPGSQPEGDKGLCM